MKVYKRPVARAYIRYVVWLPLPILRQKKKINIKEIKKEVL